MFIRSILARAFFVLSLATAGFATTFAFAPRAQAQTGFLWDVPEQRMPQWQSTLLYASRWV